MIFVLHHDAVGADVDLAGFRIFGDDAAASADVRAAVQVVPVGHGKFVEIDVLSGHLVFEDRATFQLVHRHRLVRGELFAPGVEIVDAVLLVDAHRRAGALAGAEDVGNNPKAGRIILEIIKQQRGPFFVGRKLGERAHFGLQVGAVDAAQLAHFFEQLDISAHVGNVGHEFLPMAIIVWWRGGGVKRGERKRPASAACHCKALVERLYDAHRRTSSVSMPPDCTIKKTISSTMIEDDHG